MLSLLPSLLVAQITTAPIPLMERQFLTEPQQIRALPGQLNNVLVFNSNSPEVIQTDGILLSTFPPTGKYFPEAHLNQTLSGRFDFFSHHISRPLGDRRTLYQGVIVHNPTTRWVRLRILQAASYANSPDAPFITLAPTVEDPWGRVFSGPGSRLMGDILRGINQLQFPTQIIIPPGENRMLFVLPIAPSTARSTFMRLETDGSVYMANLAMYAIAVPRDLPDDLEKPKKLPPVTFREPTIGEWRALVTMGRLAAPRDLAPTPPREIDRTDQPIYGRVAGISVGSEWIARVVDKPGIPYLSIPARGQGYSYPISTVTTGTHGTKQVQSAPMLVRYPDTAYKAHGNYAVHYSLTFPLSNNTSQPQTVTLTLQTPLKQDRYADRLFFSNSPQGPIFFRGTVRLNYIDDTGQSQIRYFHLVQRQGQEGSPLVTLNMPPGDRREVNVDFLYPPDATPPQVITVRTQELFYGRNF